MKAAVFYGVGQPLQVEDVSISKPRSHEVLIRTVASGICHSDLHIVEGALPYPGPVILGHESCGVVEAVGEDVQGVKIGDHIVTCISGFCGRCQDCLSGHMAVCAEAKTDRPRQTEPRLARQGDAPRLAQFHGLSGFAEQMLLHEPLCVAIGPEMPIDRAP